MANNLFVIHLTLTDSLMLVYLISLGVVDLSFRGSYMFYAESWKSSIMCRVMSILSSLSGEVSLVMLVSLSIFVMKALGVST